MADISAIKLPNGVTYNIKDKSLTNLVDGSATGSIRGIGNGIVDPDSYEIGEYSFVEGYNNIGSGNYAHAEGNSTHATGLSSHSEGVGTIASGEAFHAEGYSTQAIPIKDNIYGAHAEGNTTYSKGNGSHSEGVGSRAEGDASHAEGNYTVATGFASHAEGKSTIANHSSQHTFGEYNIEDASTAAATSRGNYVEIVGNGTAYNKRSNARTLDWSGNEVLAGKLTVGAVGTNSMDVATVGQLPTIPANIVNTITTTAGAHTAISSQKGNVSFNVPTKTSHLVNDSGFIDSSVLSVVATSGDYNDLSNKPTIPTSISDLTNDLYEKGTATAGSVTWKYRKWANGELEMWGSAITKLNINTAVGNIYTTANEYNIAVPSFVDSVDFVTGELSGGGWVDVTGYGVPPKMRFYAPTAYTSTDRYLRYYLKGSWV